MNATRLTKSKETVKGGVRLRFLNLERSSETTATGSHAEIRSLSDAVEVLREVAAIHSTRPIIVVDEFDRMRTRENEASLLTCSSISAIERWK